MKTKNPLVRVVKKDSEGATIKTLDGKFSDKFDWETFNTNFKQTDEKNIYMMVLDEETEKQVDEFVVRQNWLRNYMVFILRIMAMQDKKEEISLEDMGLFGHIVGEYNKEFQGLPPFQFVEDIREMKRISLVGLQ